MEDKTINFLHEYRNMMRDISPIHRRISLQEFTIACMSLIPSLDETDKTDILSLLRAEVLRSGNGGLNGNS